MLVDKRAVQISTDILARSAVDGDVNTHSCTLDTDALPWWFIDLGHEYTVSRISVTFPNAGEDARNIITALASLTNSAIHYGTDTSLIDQ